jgi:hypothetical protein
MAYDLNKILQEYGDDDFGFSAVSEDIGQIEKNWSKIKYKRF